MALEGGAPASTRSPPPAGLEAVVDMLLQGMNLGAWRFLASGMPSPTGDLPGAAL